VLLGVVGVASTTQQLRSGDRGDEFGDSVGVGIVDDDEVLRSGAMEAGEDVGFGIGHRFGRQWDAVLVAFFDPGCLVGGDVEAGFVAGPGEGDVGAFAVEAGGADDEHGVAGDALGLVDRDGVGVVDPAVVEVVAVEHDVFAAGDADGHVVEGEADDGAAHAVVDGELLAGHEVLVAVVAAHHDLVAYDVASIDSGNPFNPSHTTMHTSSTPRFLISVSTCNQYLAPSPPVPTHSPRMSRWPSTVTPIAA
jgi:hypothetical protein